MQKTKQDSEWKRGIVHFPTRETEGSPRNLEFLDTSADRKEAHMFPCQDTPARLCVVSFVVLARAKAWRQPKTLLFTHAGICSSHLRHVVLVSQTPYSFPRMNTQERNSDIPKKECPRTNRFDPFTSIRTVLSCCCATREARALARARCGSATRFGPNIEQSSAFFFFLQAQQVTCRGLRRGRLLGRRASRRTGAPWGT